MDNCKWEITLKITTPYKIGSWLSKHGMKLMAAALFKVLITLKVKPVKYIHNK